MECYCDYEMPSVYAVMQPTARKSHRCSECHGEIAPGERYERVFGVWDGHHDVFRTCPRCLALREWVKAHVPCFCWAHGNIREDAIETAREFGRQAPGLLFGAYRREVAIRRGRSTASNRGTSA